MRDGWILGFIASDEDGSEYINDCFYMWLAPGMGSTPHLHEAHRFSETEARRRAKKYPDKLMVMTVEDFLKNDDLRLRAMRGVLA